MFLLPVLTRLMETLDVFQAETGNKVLRSSSHLNEKVSLWQNRACRAPESNWLWVHTSRSEWTDVRSWNSSARFGTSLEQNQPFQRHFSVVSRGKGNRIINKLWSGRWESNPRPKSLPCKIPVDSAALTHLPIPRLCTSA
jgi:hypothetical protein